MKSIDNLREWWRDRFPVMDRQLGCDFREHIDAIEREVEELRDRDYRNGREDAEGAVEFADRLCRASERREDVTLWGVDYTALPVDADGVPIHVGDWITGDWDAKAKVVAVTSDDVYWWEPDGCHWCHAYEVRHHHAPTVEDVLREFADRVCNSGHQWGLDSADTIAEYAAKLRLAEGVDE